MKRIIPTTLKQLGIDVSVSATRVLGESKIALIRIWGEDRAGCAEMISFSDGELIVRATPSSAIVMLRNVTVPWMNEINRVLGERRVLKIRIEGDER